MRYAKGRWAEGRWDRVGARQFSVAGTGAATDAAANNCVCNLWNPSGTRSLYVTEFHYEVRGNPAALDPLRFCRTSTTGTAGSTVTPDLDNDWEQEVTPAAGALLYLSNFSVEPTLQTPELARLAFSITGGAQALAWLFRDGLKVPPGTGLAIATTGAVATATATDVSFRFFE